MNKCFEKNLTVLGIMDKNNRFELSKSRTPEELSNALAEMALKPVYLIEGKFVHTYGHIRFRHNGEIIIFLDGDEGMNFFTLTHELAHAHCGIDEGHSKTFLDEWRRLCDECALKYFKHQDEIPYLRPNRRMEEMVL